MHLCDALSTSSELALGCRDAEMNESQALASGASRRQVQATLALTPAPAS